MYYIKHQTDELWWGHKGWGKHAMPYSLTELGAAITAMLAAGFCFPIITTNYFS